MRKMNMVIIMKRKKVQRVAKKGTKKDTKRAPRPLDIIIRHIKMSSPRRKNSTIAKIRKVTTRNMAANTNSTSRRKVNTRKVGIISLTMIRGTKARRDTTRKAITMKITRDTRVNMATISIIHITIIMVRRAAKRAAAKRDTNQKDINQSNRQCNAKDIPYFQWHVY